MPMLWTLIITEDDVDDGEAHLEYAVEALGALQEGFLRHQVAEAHRGQGDEAEVEGRSQVPFLPLAEDDGADEEEEKHDDQVNHDRDVDIVRGHVGLLPDLVVHDPLGLAVGVGRQLGISAPDAAPAAADTAEE